MTGRLGLLGGTFDPIHYGHLDAADAACAALTLDRVRLIPTHDPPHRRLDPRGGAFHRFALVALAIQQRQGWSVSDVELRRDGRSYTSDTLRAVHAEGWTPAQIFFILGADAFAEIASWHEFPAVLDLSNFVVVARPGSALDRAAERTPALRSRTRVVAAGGVRDALAPDTGGTRVFLLEAQTRAVSSTQIRSRLSDGLSIDDLVPAAVARHIMVHQLYGAVDDLHGEEQHSHG